MSRERDIARVALAGSLALGACGPVVSGKEGQVNATEPRTAEITPTPSFTLEPTSTPTETPTDTPTPEPTATPDYYELQRLKPEGTKGEVVMGEEGRLQLRMEFDEFDVPEEGLVIGEYREGQWKQLPFTFTNKPEVTREIIDFHRLYFNEAKELNYGFFKLSYSGFPHGVRFEVNEQTGETDITLLMLFRDGRLIKINPDRINIDDTRFDPNRLSLSGISQILDMLGGFYPPEQTMLFYSHNFSVGPGMTEEECHNSRLHRNFGDDPSFTEHCLMQLRDEERLINSTADLNAVEQNYTVLINQSEIEAADWWDDQKYPSLPESLYNHIYLSD